MPRQIKYVLITPARNEQDYIEQTIQSVVGQSCLPVRWVIVSDGSTDDTERIVESYVERYQWIELIKLPSDRNRNFAAKVGAFNSGLARLVHEDYDVIGCLDADISFGPGYLDYLITQFEDNRDLGVAGTHYTEDGFHSYNDSYMNEEHVSGGCQLFRRKCFEQIGGYVANKAGGIDWIAVTTARMMGWDTKSFSGETFEHHRKIGTAQTSVLGARFHYGRKDYFLGGHPLWQLCRSTFQMRKKPYVLGGMCLFSGYFWAWVRGEARAVSPELMEFHRSEQMVRLKQVFRPWANSRKEADSND
jgi:glycosyltransferase involved in cell wall biosynthesis